MFIYDLYNFIYNMVQYKKITEFVICLSDRHN